MMCFQQYIPFNTAMNMNTIFADNDTLLSLECFNGLINSIGFWEMIRRHAFSIHSSEFMATSEKSGT